MNLLCKRILSDHNYSLELPDWLVYSKDLGVFAEAYEYHRGGKYSCELSEIEYSEHYLISDRQIKHILNFYYECCVGRDKTNVQ